MYINPKEDRKRRNEGTENKTNKKKRQICIDLAHGP